MGGGEWLLGQEKLNSGEGSEKGGNIRGPSGTGNVLDLDVDGGSVY